MSKIVYLMRHSKPMKVTYLEDIESVQLINEKCILSEDGEELAKERSTLLEEVDKVYSSNYVRAMATAKYFAKDKEIYIMKEFRERIQGINSWDELPKDFELKQFNDWNYKVGFGESLNEVRERITEGLYKVLNDMTDEIVLIVSHCTALRCLLSNWCDLNFNDTCYYDGQELFDGKSVFCETFRLEFNDKNELLTIDYIK